MKKEYSAINLIILVILSVFMFSSFSKNNISTVKGYINVYGNTPFEFIGIETTDNKQYAINATEEEIADLRNTQGKLVEITGIITPSKDEKLPNMLKDGKIEVVEWKVVK